MTQVSITKSKAKGKKYQAVFYKDNGDKIKTVQFGASGMNDYIIYNRIKGSKYANERKKLYLQRHVNEKGGMMTASTLSKMILWNKSTFESSYRDYKQRFNLSKY
jgi:hypothetical protein